MIRTDWKQDEKHDESDFNAVLYIILFSHKISCTVIQLNRTVRSLSWSSSSDEEHTVSLSLSLSVCVCLSQEVTKLQCDTHCDIYLQTNKSMREAHFIPYWELWLHRAIQEALIMFARVWVTVVSQGSKPTRYFSFSCAGVFCYLQMYCPSYLTFPSKKHTHDHTYSTYWVLPFWQRGSSRETALMLHNTILCLSQSNQL